MQWWNQFIIGIIDIIAIVKYYDYYYWNTIIIITESEAPHQIRNIFPYSLRTDYVDNPLAFKSVPPQPSIFPYNWLAPFAHLTH